MREIKGKEWEGMREDGGKGARGRNEGACGRGRGRIVREKGRGRAREREKELVEEGKEDGGRGKEG
jgi:hypothetical protein